MYSFIIATVVLRLPFSLTRSIVVSSTESANREGWPFVDTIPERDICHVPTMAATGSVPVEAPVLPTGLHYCKRYLLGKVSDVVIIGRHCTLKNTHSHFK
jgi:hypothetical protein